MTSRRQSQKGCLRSAVSILFFSYAHRDETLRDELEIHLSTLKHQGVLETWHDRRITAGEEVHKENSNCLQKADVILLLVSPYFLGSDYCYQILSGIVPIGEVGERG
jgi:hypothetical protein